MNLNSNFVVGNIIPANNNPIVASNNKDILQKLKDIELLLQRLPDEIAKRITEISQH